MTRKKSKVNYSYLLFLIIISSISSCGISTDDDLIGLKAKPLLNGQTIEEYFNEVAGIGGNVNWENLNSNEQNVKKYKVNVVRRGSIHKVDLEVTFIYDDNTKNYAVDSALFEGGSQNLSEFENCFNGIRIAMEAGWKLKD